MGSLIKIAIAATGVAGVLTSGPVGVALCYYAAAAYLGDEIAERIIEGVLEEDEKDDVCPKCGKVGGGKLYDIKTEHLYGCEKCIKKG